MWNCKCGKQCPDDASFCPQCGSKRESSNNNEIWFYLSGGERKGPFSIGDIIDSIKRGEITQDTPVWHSGFSEWKSAGQTELGKHMSATVPPVSKTQLNDKWLWCLATLPISIDMLIYQLSLSNIFHMDSNIVTILVIALNCVFLTLDIRYLRRAGYDAKKWLFLGLLLVPAYLFVRALKTNKNFIPLIFWCGIYCTSYLPMLFW